MPHYPSTTIAQSTINGPVVQVGAMHGNIVLSDVGYEIRDLVSGTKGDPPPLGACAQMAPSRLLEARQAIVPFSGREAELSRLLTWANDQTVTSSVLLLHGAGGAGKTRLAGYFATSLVEAGWHAVEARELFASSGPQHKDTDTRPTVAVIDYADRWNRRTLIKLVNDLIVSRGGLLRILLIARPGQQFWKHIRRDISFQDKQEPIELSDFVSADVQIRREAYAVAYAAFGRALGLADPSVTQFPGDLESGPYRTPLDLHMSALAAAWAVTSGQVPPSRAKVSEDYLLDHERRCWGEDEDDSLEQTVLLSTLLGPVDEDVARHIIESASLADGPAAASALIHRHERHYPIASTELPQLVLQPLRPDRFGEDFVGSSLSEGSSFRRLLNVLMNDSLTDQMLQHSLRVISAAGMRYDRATALTFEALRRSENDGSRRLMSLTSIETINLISERAESGFANWFVLHVMPERDERSELIGLLALRLARSLPPDTPLPEQLHLWRACVGHLQSAGVVMEAIEPAKRASEIAGLLAARNPAHYSAEHAALLTGYAEILWQAGYGAAAIEPASEGVELLRRVVEEAGASDLRPYYAIALMQYGTILAESSNELQAGLHNTERAVEIFSTLDLSDLENRSLLSLAKSNLSVRLEEHDRFDEAFEHQRQCVELLQPLAGVDPSLDFRLAGALSNYSVGLSRKQSYAEARLAAVEAIEIMTTRLGSTELYRRLVAVCLICLAQAQLGLRQIDDAVNSFREAVEEYQNLSEANPARGIPDALKYIRAFSGQMSELLDDPSAQQHELILLQTLAEAAFIELEIYERFGAVEPALAVARRRIHMTRRLSTALPDDEDSLMMHLTLIQFLVSNSPRRQDSDDDQELMSVCVEWTEIAKRLRSTRVDGWEFWWFGGMAEYCRLSIDLEFFDDALRIARETLDLAETFSQENEPNVFYLALAQSRYSAALNYVDRMDEALETARSAHQSYQKLIAMDPDSFRHQSRMAAFNLAAISRDRAQNGAEAITLLENLRVSFDQDRGDDLSLHADVLDALIDELRKDGQNAQADLVEAESGLLRKEED